MTGASATSLGGISETGTSGAPTPTPSTGSSNSLSTGAITGICLGGLFVLSLISAIIHRLRRPGSSPFQPNFTDHQPFNQPLGKLQPKYSSYTLQPLQQPPQLYLGPYPEPYERPPSIDPSESISQVGGSDVGSLPSYSVRPPYAHTAFSSTAPLRPEL